VYTWQMQEAKARLSELVKRAESEGPQNITLRQSPLYGLDEIELERDRSLTREIEL